MLFLLCLSFIFIICVLLDRFVNKDFFHIRRSCQEPKVKCPLGFIGSGTILLSAKDSEGLFKMLISFSNTFTSRFILTFFRSGAIYLYNPTDIKAILSSTQLIEKSSFYNFLRPWLGNGILTAKGEHWRSHRKILISCFHSSIILDNLITFNKNAHIFCDLLEEKVGKQAFNIDQPLRRMTMDNVYEAVMGISHQEQLKSNSNYLEAIKKISNIVILRAFTLKARFLFRFTNEYKEQQDAISTLHAESNGVIVKRKKELEEEIKKCGRESFEQNLAERKRLAFLDLLLLRACEFNMSNEEIREEVDNFLFGGHDTVSTSLAFAIYALGKYQDFQEEAFQEQKQLFGTSQRSPTNNELKEMNYLERFICESLRFYPTVPLLERVSSTDVILPSGLKIPKGMGISLFIYALHRNPDIWSQPETFNPDNFLPEAVRTRDPYAFVPFSAGPRNCLGKRFAMIELKATLSIILRRFKILPSLNNDHDLKLSAELVLVSKSGVHICLQKRNTNNF